MRALLLSLLLLATPFGAMASTEENLSDGAMKPVQPQKLLARVSVERIKNLPARLRDCAGEKVTVAVGGGILTAHLPEKDIRRCKLWPGRGKPSDWAREEYLTAWGVVNGLTEGALRNGGDRRLSSKGGWYYPLDVISGSPWAEKLASEAGIVADKKATIATDEPRPRNLSLAAAAADAKTATDTRSGFTSAAEKKPGDITILSGTEKEAIAAKKVRDEHFPVEVEGKDGTLGQVIVDPDRVQVIRIPGTCTRGTFTQESCFAVYLDADPVTGLGGVALTRNGTLHWVGPGTASTIDEWSRHHTTNPDRYEYAKANRKKITEDFYRGQALQAEIASQKAAHEARHMTRDLNMFSILRTF